MQDGYDNEGACVVFIVWTVFCLAIGFIFGRYVWR